MSQRAFVSVVAVCLVLVGQGFAQQNQPQPVRRPVIDLDEQARARRPGQVRPGDKGVTPDAPPVTPREDPVDRPPMPRIPIEATDPAPADPPEAGVDPMREAPRVARVPAGERVSEQEYAQERILGYGPVYAEVTRIDGPPRRVQWRAISAYDGVRGPWHTPRPGERLNGRVEIRTGLGTTLHVRVEDGADIIVERLTRATIEQALMPDAASALSIDLRRGRVGIHPIRPRQNGPILLRTPDVATWVSRNLKFDFDAFAGTMRSPLVDY